MSLIPKPTQTFATIDCLRRQYRQGLIFARCDYSDLVVPHTANTPTPELYLGHLKGALIAARNTAIGMLQNGYDLVSVVADKALAADGSVPYGDEMSFFGTGPPLPATERDTRENDERRAFAGTCISNGRLLWHVAAKLPRDDIVKYIDMTAKAKPTVNSQVKGPASTITELTVYLVGHGFKDEDGCFHVAYDVKPATQDNEVKFVGGYTITQLLHDLKLNTRWQHLLIIADACTAGAILASSCHVPDKAEAFIDADWHYAYHGASYQFIGSSLNDTQGQSAEAWQGTVFSMAMHDVLWCKDPTAFTGAVGAEPYNWATVSYVVERLRESMNAKMASLYPTATDLAPTCLQGRLHLAMHTQTLQRCHNLGQFLFVRRDAPTEWPYQGVNLIE